MQFSWWYLFVSIPVIWSLWIGFRVFRGINKPSDFFWYPEGMSSEKLRDSLTASNISVGSAIVAFLSFGYSYKLAAFICFYVLVMFFFGFFDFVIIISLYFFSLLCLCCWFYLSCIRYFLVQKIRKREHCMAFWPIVMIVDLSVISLLCYRSSDSWVPMVQRSWLG